MDPKLFGGIAATIVLVATLGYAITNPEAIGAFAGSLRGAATGADPTLGPGKMIATVGSSPPFLVQSLTGCTTTIEVTVLLGSPADSGRFQEKVRGASRMEPCVFTAEWSQGTAETLGWARSALADPSTRAHATFLLVDGHSNMVSRRIEARDALLLNVSTPTLDATISQNPVFTFTLLPDQIVDSLVRETPPSLPKSSPSVGPSGWRVSLDGTAISFVRLGAVTIGTGASELSGNGRYSEAGPATVGDFRLKGTGQAAQHLHAWYKSAMAHDPAERTLRLDLLDAGGRVVWSATFGGVGLSGLSGSTDAGALVAHLFAERVTLSP